MRAYHRSLARSIQRFRDGFDQLAEAHPQTAAQQLASLAGAARSHLVNMLHGPLDEVHRLARVIATACPTWRTGRNEPIIHIVSPLQHHIPWEILPLFDLRQRFTARDNVELARQAAAFLGFGARIERQSPELTSTDTVLDANGYLQIRFLQDASYTGVQEEMLFLDGLLPGVRVEGPYPPPCGSDEEPTVGQQLVDPTVGVDGSRRDKPDQIVHFGCHCAGGEAESWEDLEFRFSDGSPASQRTLKLHQLIDDMVMADPWDHPTAGERMPLVFINACGGAVIDPGTAVSMLTPFEKLRSRGMIGTTANVPDRVAAKFSRWFYIELFRGLSVTEAVSRARMRLLTDYANPLGLLYVYVGLPDLRALPIIEPIRQFA
jgi:hypothetical protein